MSFVLDFATIPIRIDRTIGDVLLGPNRFGFVLLKSVFGNRPQFQCTVSKNVIGDDMQPDFILGLQTVEVAVSPLYRDHFKYNFTGCSWNISGFYRRYRV